MDYAKLPIFYKEKFRHFPNVEVLLIAFEIEHNNKIQYWEVVVVPHGNAWFS